MARRRTVEEWRGRWLNGRDVSAWTRRLIWNIKTWLKSNYYLTQFLIGHMSFGMLTHIILTTRHYICYLCRAQDSTQHVLRTYKGWNAQIKKIMNTIGKLPRVEECSYIA
ncbi:hypothetical protein WA026_002118 [Henosepilachna vigintioctopunctata]|uniref:Uncharacterized protein n=1 Tax=Henosepilachna vigintioctopunctata TaxID=420089 RepID=A0AAW1TYK1_9CUCU